MGRRSRKRTGAEPAPHEPLPEAPPPRARTPRRHAKLDEAPPAPWHPFPLVELAILAGIILSVVAFVVRGDAFAPLLLGGLALIALASSELALREHLAGYRSHSALLALLIAFPAGAATYSFITEEKGAVLVVFGVVFVAVFLAMRQVFIKRSGGFAWRA